VIEAEGVREDEDGQVVTTVEAVIEAAVVDY
jgi:hypothetical protein